MAARACDSCKGSPALLFCRADSAFLCGACDARIHGAAANRLPSRHERVWLCQVCEQAPAAVTCKADAATLCVTCDADIHSANTLARRHDRSPVVPFCDSPAALHAGEDPHILLKPSDDDDDDNGNAPAEVDVDHRKVPMEPPVLKAVDYFFFPDVDPYLDLDYLSSVVGRHDHSHHTDSIVPVQTNPVSTAAAHPPKFVSHGGSADFDLGKPKPCYGSYSTSAHSLSHSISSSEVGVVPEGSAMADVSKPYDGGVAGQDREARLMRYREKRKNRKFEKRIRYASRKAYAETRPRIKGRFARRAAPEMEAEPIYAAMADHDYGVVPSF